MNATKDFTKNELARLTQLVAEYQEEAKIDSQSNLLSCITGRMLEITRGKDQHPDNYNHPCECDLCLSYEEND